ncbi:MAG: glycosyltransferase [Acidobacteriota bacterium]|nr:glycosyltransferase [Acidobacteriota bacterium]
MKIVRIIARLNVGGPARHVVWLTEELNDDEFQSVLLAGTVPEGEEDMSYFAENHLVEPFHIPEMSRELSPKDVVSLWKVYRRFVIEQPDIIHTHTAKAGTVGRAAAFLYRWLNWRKVTIIHTFHGHIFHSYYGKLKTNVFLIIEKILARLATDVIIVITRQQFDEIHGQFGVGRAGQFEIVPLGIDLQPFRGSREKRDILRVEIGAADDEILVGFVGRLTEIKNVSLLLEVAAIYRRQTDESLPKLKFLIIGDGNSRTELEKESERRGLQETVKFLGNRNDADVFYAGLDIVALTSLNEGTPLSLIEAMANEKPVISTAVGGVIDLLGETQTEADGFTVCERGIKISANSAEDFYKGLIYLAKNETLQKSLAVAGKEFVEAKYSKERLVGDIKELYRVVGARTSLSAISPKVDEKRFG